MNKHSNTKFAGVSVGGSTCLERKRIAIRFDSAMKEVKSFLFPDDLVTTFSLN